MRNLRPNIPEEQSPSDIDQININGSKSNVVGNGSANGSNGNQKLFLPSTSSSSSSASSTLDHNNIGNNNHNHSSNNINNSNSSSLSVHDQSYVPSNSTKIKNPKKNVNLGGVKESSVAATVPVKYVNGQTDKNQPLTTGKKVEKSSVSVHSYVPQPSIASQRLRRLEAAGTLCFNCCVFLIVIFHLFEIFTKNNEIFSLYLFRQSFFLIIFFTISSLIFYF